MARPRPLHRTGVAAATLAACAHPEYFLRNPDSCLVCIHRPLDSAQDILNQEAIRALGGWDHALHDAFEPSVECLGYWDDDAPGTSKSAAR